ncbi:hypothetical protein C8P66_12765 [Humitalea rosea]|uniref:NfeD-like C-terminal domain-containing protein n=1 Tax=Humitalea rosea TaxID=990373 RepID=A0A2W7I338_9PROT|nr:NfeD family protein [Humitalea rosea]PZW39862.1 hypothetical protein C8P66_12765 [Humitalea rosea]
MADWLIWVLAGIGFLAGELALPGVFLLWIGIAAIGAGLAIAALDPPFWGVSLVFLALLAAGIAAALRLRRTLGAARVNTAGSGLTGRFGTVIGPDPGGLRVRLGDSDWAARLPGDVRAMPEAGHRVRVEAVDGTVLIVRPS